MIRLLILATIIFCFKLSAYSAENSTSEKASTTKKTPAKQTDKTEKISESTSAAVNKAVTDTNRQLNSNNTETQEKKEEKSPNESWWRKLFNDPVAFFTCLLFAATLMLWWATRKLVRGSERTSEQQLRAYVYTKHDHPATRSEEGHMIVSVWVKNFGQTPAKDLTSFLHISLQKLPLTVALDPPTYEPTSSKSPLAPGEKVLQEITFAETLNQTEIKAIINEEAAIFVHGELLYTDVFDKKRFTRFCLYSSGEAFKEGMFAYYHDGNEAN